jgi:hypothetical protein
MINTAFQTYVRKMAGKQKGDFDPQPVFDLLDQLRIRWILVGGLAVNAHGYERGTGDIDLFIASEDFERAKSIGEATAVPLRRLVGNMRVDIMSTLAGVSFYSAWEKSELIQGIRVISKEHLIQNKRAVGRAQDLLDVEKLLEEPDKEVNEKQSGPWGPPKSVL